MRLVGGTSDCSLKKKSGAATFVEATWLVVSTEVGGTKPSTAVDTNNMTASAVVMNRL